MKVAIYSRTPLAAAPWEIYKALKKYTSINVALINENRRYPDGRSFPCHLLIRSNDGTARAWLDQSDVWHVHNYWTRTLQDIRHDQRILAQFHSVPKMGNWKELMSVADESYTIQQPLQMKEYNLSTLPNIIDPDEYRPIKREKKIKIAFAPTTRLRYGHVASKAYYEVRTILQDIALKKGVDIIWIEGKPYKENLRMKSEAHILIDDVATGNWHRTSLEGGCFGCAVINKVKKHPFVYAGIKDLKEKLIWLIDNPGTLRDIQHWTRLWVLQDWHAIDRIQEYAKAYEGLYAR
jgi:hypothetical protein